MDWLGFGGEWAHQSPIRRGNAEPRRAVAHRSEERQQLPESIDCAASIWGGAASRRPAALRWSREERWASARRHRVDLGRSSEPALRRSGEEPRAGSRRRCVDLGRSDGGAWNGVGGAAAGRRRNGGRWASLELGFHVYLWRSGNWAGPWKFSYPRRVDWKKAHEFCRLTMRRTKWLIPTDFQTMKINMYTDW